MAIRHEIVNYVMQNILPKYESFDEAHNLEHVNRVIKNSLSIASDYSLDINKVYIIAAYHDIGLSQGRTNHEKTSAALLLLDTKLKEWFSDDELRLMSEAVEDHRASNSYEPRSIYGKIVSEADRDIEYITILTRIIQYSLDNYPEFSFEQHFTRSYEHIRDKYGENGYLKLWLDTEINRKNLHEVRRAVASLENFKADFENVFYTCIKNKSKEIN
ncbi:MAG: HD domain-containing protein [Defluviitaleaceae bacterium]|nr:HD domain-containing protein [Defluviitaleaceae bacterium]